MRLRKIVMQNFKQYYGEQTIEFSGVNEDDKSNVTVVYGENGRGKTTLYRSMLFGFYGDRYLEQDEFEDNKDSVIYLANLKAIDEAAERGKGITVGVTIDFSHNNERYEIRRYFNAIKDQNGEIHEDLPSVKLTIIKDDGNTEYHDESKNDDIREIINSILDERVKNYFLFDGERIESLTKASKKQKENIRTGIKNLLKIDNLFLLKQALEESKRDLNSELKKISTGEMFKNLQEIEAVDEKLANIQNKIDSIVKDLNFAESQKAEIDRKLKEIEEQRPTLNRILDLEKAIDALKEEHSQSNQQMVELTSSLSVLLAKDTVGELIADLEGQRIRGEVPSEIKTELIDRLLNEMSCICGRELSIGSKEYESLLNWKQKSNTQVYEKHAMKLFGDLKTTASHIMYSSNSISQSLTNAAQIEEQLEIYTNDYERLKKDVGEISEQDMVNDFQYRDTLMKDIARAEQQLESYEAERDEALKYKETLEKKQKSLKVENELQAQITRQLEIVDKSLTALNEIIQSFEQEIKVELESKANDIFKNLIDEGGSTNLKKIIVKDNYTLDVLDWSGRPFLANISAGQRQIISLSFITALAAVAGGTSMLEIPLFMDTPFGRLSPDHRYNLVSHIPTITPQWILLVTGSEFKEDEEAKFLKDTGKWGKFYLLDAISEGVTKIEEVSPEDLSNIKAIERSKSI
ncbi:AAA family ATPase [Paucisalibacillus globulus]|uniref:AAA family ATPase n=1 Tax=Paucisalibacillus globulus TaxID=351095 RepID=UPI000BB87D3B|nr:AAA family ATPase [Paucisalibacillus globulus]